MTPRTPFSGQRTLDLGWSRRTSYRRADWIESPANAHALALAEGRVATVAPAIAIFGPEGSGKTHLAAIWAEKNEAELVELSALPQTDIRALAEAGALVIEDYDRLECNDIERALIETALHHLYNIMHETGGQLFLTGRHAPARWQIALADLKSRLSSVPSFPIEQLDDASLRLLIARLFDYRGLQVEADVIEFLARRTGRGYGTIAQLVETLDAANLNHKRPITIHLAKEILSW